MSRPSHRTAASQRHPALRNPWLEGAPFPGPPSHPPPPDARPGSRSSGSTTYDGYIPVDGPYAPEPPPPPWQFTHASHGTLRTIPAQSPVYEIPAAGSLPRRPALGPALGPPPPSSERPLTPGALTQGSLGSGASGGCGGCDTLDTWCYYCVQAVLGVAALAGVSLLIAAAVLRAQPPRAAAANLSALPYIGAMLAAVSGALLVVQKCARNEKKRKKRLQQQRAGAAGLGTLRRQGGATTAGVGISGPGPCAPGDLIPLQDLHSKPLAKPLAKPALQLQSLHAPHVHAPHLQHQFQPLLPRPHQNLRPGDVPLSPSGTPWWRRQPAYPGRAVHPS